ncbi:MAG: PhoH family protein [bacterium]
MPKKYILDTNVIIENPDCIHILRNGQENQIYIPNHVLSELDKLKTENRLTPTINRAIRLIEENLDWLNIIDNPKSHSDMTSNIDDKIFKEISNHSGLEDAYFVTNDKMARIKAKKYYNINSQEFLESNPYKSESQIYTGFSDDLDEIVENSFTWDKGKPCFHSKGKKRPINYENNAWKIKPNNVYQNLALDLFLNNDLDIVTVQSDAGLGKTTLALAAALRLVFQEKNNLDKIIITKMPTEDYRMGFIPGDLDEKFYPAIRPIKEILFELHQERNIPKKAFKNKDPETEEFNKRFIELLPFNYLQGMNIKNSILIIDEGQNLKREQMRTILTRCAMNTRAFIIGDTRQIQNPYINEENNGLNWVVRLCKGQNNFGHIVLKGKQSRGPVTDLVLKVGL